MGDITEMVLEGILCEACGIYIEDGEVPGHPRKCESCEPTKKSRRVNDLLKRPLDELLGIIRSHFEDEETKVTVATATEAQVARLLANRHRREDLETEIARKLDDFAKKIEREYKPKHDELNQEHQDAWREIEASNGLNPNKDYGLNYVKREIYERIQPEGKNRDGVVKIVTRLKKEKKDFH